MNVSINCVKLGKLDLTIKADTENCHNRTFHKRCKTFVQSEIHVTANMLSSFYGPVQTDMWKDNKRTYTVFSDLEGKVQGHAYASGHEEKSFFFLLST